MLADGQGLDGFLDDNGDAMTAFLRDVQKGDYILLDNTASQDKTIVSTIVNDARRLAVPLKR